MDLLKFVLGDSCDGMHCQQVFGCALYSRLSVQWLRNVSCPTQGNEPCTPFQLLVIGGLGIWTTPTYNRRKPYVNIFHKRLKSIKDNIQFTIEDACQTNKGQTICFLDSRTTMLSDGCVEIDVYKKKIHINRYLDFASYNPMQNKEVVVKTLLHGPAYYLHTLK